MAFALTRESVCSDTLKAKLAGPVTGRKKTVVGNADVLGNGLLLLENGPN